MIEIRRRQTGAVLWRVPADCLAGAQLERADLRAACLAGADLSEARLCGACLAEADLTGANVRRAHLNGADLRGADLSGADLTGAQFSMMALEAPPGEGVVHPAGVFEVIFGDAPEGPPKRLRIAFPAADLRRATLRDARLDGALLAGVDLREAVLAGATLCGANLASARLDGVDLTNALYNVRTVWPRIGSNGSSRRFDPAARGARFAK